MSLTKYFIYLPYIPFSNMLSKLTGLERDEGVSVEERGYYPSYQFVIKCIVIFF